MFHVTKQGRVECHETRSTEYDLHQTPFPNAYHVVGEEVGWGMADKKVVEYNVGDRLRSRTNRGDLKEDHMYVVATSDSANKIVTLRSQFGESVEGSFTWRWLQDATSKLVLL